MAGDRANDAVRITGKRPQGQGDRRRRQSRRHPARRASNAAFTGVRLNTDAVDNSAGVNTSDVEVNIKIALVDAGARRQADDRGAQQAARRNDRRCRARWSCATTICRRLALSLSQRRGLEDLGFQQRLMQVLEQRDLLDRGVEFLPMTMKLAERRKRECGADPARTRRAAGLRQARAVQRPDRFKGAGRSLSVARALPLFPARHERAFRRRR